MIVDAVADDDDGADATPTAADGTFGSGVEGSLSLHDICVRAIGNGTALQAEVTVSFTLGGEGSKYYFIHKPNIIPQKNLCCAGMADLVQPYIPEAVIPASQLTGCTSFSVFDDDLVEPTEVLVFTLDEISPSLGITIGEPRTFDFFITDNDGILYSYGRSLYVEC